MKHRIIRPILLAATACVTGAWASGTHLSAATTPLYVGVRCSGTQCTALASGGSGTYVGIDWNTGYEMWDADGISTVEVRDECAPNLFIGVIATVTDSNGATATNSSGVHCPNR